jgi:transcriptional regulator with XRE-family HTH domain
MSPSDLARLNEDIIDNCKAAARASGRKLTQREVADTAGVDETEISHRVRGSREWKASELIRLARAFGEKAVLGPIQERVQARPSPGASSVLELSAHASSTSAQLTAAVAVAAADGRLTQAELEALLPKAREMEAEAVALRRRLEIAQAGVQ